MPRIFLILGLLLSFFLLVGSMTATWREEAVPAVGVAEKTRPGTAPERRKLDFYPAVPARLPDLNKGYVFNEARFLADEKSGGEGVAEAAADATLDEMSYIGSVISGERRIGVIAYSEKSTSPQSAAVRGRGRPGVATPPIENKHARLAPGDIFSGYTVNWVLPDRIVFEKDGMMVEKLLAADKERKQPPPQLQGARSTPRQNSRARVFSPQRVEPASRAAPGIGSEPGRPPVPNGQVPGALIQNGPPQIIRGGE